MERGKREVRMERGEEPGGRRREREGRRGRKQEGKRGLEDALVGKGLTHSHEDLSLTPEPTSN